MTKKYFVTFCVLDGQVVRHRFWHSCLLLSEAEKGKKMRVVSNWGFYGLPATDRNSWAEWAKKQIGLNVSFTGNHGLLRHENTRFLDKGFGLHGVTFELTNDEFERLQQKCQKMECEQNAAIAEIVTPLDLSGKSPEDTRIYPYEHVASHIYALEKERAKSTNTQPRLKPFEVNFSFTMWGPVLNQSQTCKTQSIALLTGILSPEQINRLTENGKHPTVPRYSGPMEKMFLHSTGPLRPHVKSSGKTVYYRDAKKDVDVQLYWTLPPQEFEYLSEETRQLLGVNEEDCDDYKIAIEKLQRLEWLFINAVVPDKYKQYRDDLIMRIQEHYEKFSVAGCGDENEDSHHLENIRDFTDTLYIAMVDGWHIYDDSLPATDQGPLNKDDDVFYNELEALASYLSVEDKKELCAIIGRSYVEPIDEPRSAVAP